MDKPLHKVSRKLATAKVLHHSVEIDGLADPVLLILDLLNPKSTGFDRLSSTTAVPIFF